MSTATVLQETYVRNAKVVSRKIENETLVVPIRGGVGDLDSIYSFNAIGSEIWALLEKECSFEEIAEWIVEHYEVSPAQAHSDLQNFLNDLSSLGLVARVTSE